MPNILPDLISGPLTKSSSGIGRHNRPFGLTDYVPGAEYPFAIPDKRFLPPSVQALQGAGPYHNGCNCSPYHTATVANLLPLPSVPAFARLLTQPIYSFAQCHDQIRRQYVYRATPPKIVRGRLARREMVQQFTHKRHPLTPRLNAAKRDARARLGGSGMGV